MKKFLSLLMVLLAVMIMTGCKKPDNKSGNFTYHTFIQGMPNTFNVHTWETNDDSLVITYTELGLYDFVLNETKDGYDILPEMAAAEPVDVTAQYAGNATFGVPADATEGYAFTIDLNQAAKWANGTAINADTYIYSMQQMLNPEMQNYRADSFTQGTLVLANAEDYLKQGQSTYITLGTYMAKNGITDLQTAIDTATTDNLTTYINYVYSFGSMPDGSEAEDKIVATDMTLQELYDVYNATATWTDQATRDVWVLDELYVSYTFPVYDWANVGLIKTGDYQITLVLAKPITDFYLKYNLSGNWIVYEDLYEAGKTKVGDLVQTNYGTNVENYMSYGPYKLVTWQMDKVIELAKNDNWYGYTDGKHTNQFQTTNIKVDIIPEHATALMAFLKGDLDDISLLKDDVAEFKFSENILYSPESYSSKLTFNTDPATLKTRETEAGANVDKEIFANAKFREAVSYALDRQNFVQTQTAGSQATLGLLNSQYISNVDTGEVYNTTQAFKDIIERIYGTENPTGYDIAKAKELFEAAYQEQLTAGLIDADDKIEIEFSVYQMDSAYTDKVVFLQKAIDAATKGTSLEGRIRFGIRQDADYYNSAAKGDFDIIWATWGGMTMDTFGFMQVYVKNGTHNEYGFDPEAESFTMTVKGEELTKTYWEWFVALNDGEYSALNCDYDTRLLILAEMEYNILTQYRTIPVYSRTTVALTSDKINYATRDFVPIVSFGGIRFMTYNYNDSQWADYIAKGVDYTD